MATTSTTLAERPDLLARGKQVAGGLRRAPLIPLAIIVIVVFTATFAPLLTPHSTTKPSLADRLTPPMWQGGRQLGAPPGYRRPGPGPGDAADVRREGVAGW